MASSCTGRVMDLRWATAPQVPCMDIYWLSSSLGETGETTEASRTSRSIPKADSIRPKRSKIDWWSRIAGCILNKSVSSRSSKSWSAEALTECEYRHYTCVLKMIMWNIHSPAAWKHTQLEYGGIDDKVELPRFHISSKRNVKRMATGIYPRRIYLQSTTIN